MTGKQSIKQFMKSWAKKRENSLTFKQQYDETFKEIDNFMRGNQWSDTKKKNWLSTPVNNTLHIVKNAKVAAISETQAIIKTKPLIEDDIDISEQVEKLLMSYFEHENLQNTLIDVKQDSRQFPIGYLKIKFDGSAIVGTENNLSVGDFKFTPLKPTNVYWDSKATRDEELEYIFETHKITIEDLKNTSKYDKNVVADIIEYRDSMARADGNEDGEILDRNYDVVDDGKNIIVYEIYYRWKPTPGSDYKYGEIHTASKGSEDEMENIPLYYKVDLGIKRHPIIPLREYKFTHEFLGRSSVQLTLDKQKQVNKVDSITANIANQLQNQQKIVSADSGIDPQVLAMYGDAAGLVITTKTDINNSVKYLEGAKIPAELLAYKKDSKEDIYEVANITPTSVGQNAGSLGSSTGVNNLISQAASMEVIPRAAYKKFLTNIVKTMLEMIVKNKKKITKRIDNHDPDLNEEYSFLELDIEEIKNKAFDISIDIRMTQAEIAQQKQEVMQIISLQASTGTQILTPETIIDLMNFPDKERILAVMHGKKESKSDDEMLQVAQTAAMIMANEISQAGPDNENVTVDKMAQIAATEAMQRVKGGPQQEGGKPTGSAPGSSGAAAPQPQAASAASGVMPQ